MQDSKLNTYSELPLHWTPYKANGMSLPGSFLYQRMISNMLSSDAEKSPPREMLASWVRVCDPLRDLEEPVWVSAPQFPHLENWDIAAPAACGLLYRDGEDRESRLCEGFELSDYIKVKVLRTEISQLQGKSAWSLKMLPWKSQCWYDFCQRDFFPSN